MLRKYLIPAIILSLITSITACNHTDVDEITYSQSSSVVVSAFTLSPDKKVLDSLQNVFFSIDLVNARIFNADSLPYGTDVTKLVPKITTASSASEVTLRYYNLDIKGDSIVNYLKNSTDSINFANGPVILTVVSENGSVKRDYEIKVNVHTVKADSLVWYRMDSAPLPSSFKSIKSQYTAYLSGKYYCVTESNEGEYSLATTYTPDDPKWQIKSVTFPFTPEIESLRFSSDALYMLDTDGNMYKSTDFEAWEYTSQKWHYIYGAYGDKILGSRLDDGTYKIVSYPDLKTWVAPLNFPVEGTSIPSFYDLPMSYSLQTVMLGGRLADGSLTSDAWGFDGSEWAVISIKKLPIPLEDITMVPYRLSEMLVSNWAPTSYPVLLAFGGRAANGAVNRMTYYSRDWGMTWKKGDDLIQMPADVPPFYRASAFTYTTTMHVSRGDNWMPITLLGLPGGARFMLPDTSASRAITPITEWSCPAIYLFGGRTPDGETLNSLWRGVITQYTFVPVQ